MPGTTSGSEPPPEAGIEYHSRVSDGPETQEGTRTQSPATPGPAPRLLPPCIGAYRILGLIGEGGMGTVYEALQEKPERKVALKVIKPGVISADALRRFDQETRLLGKLHHAGIAQIYEAGTADAGQGPQPYFAMEWIQGETLRGHAERAHFGVRDKLALMARICDAVHHAHQKAIIHRDLKPGNILIDETGQPKILDFGVARATDADRQATLHTTAGEIVGTLPYMSPEQVSADPSDLDIRSDVYALGVILYELLAGKRPYEVRGTLAEAVRTVAEVEPTPLRTLDRAFRGDVDTIVGKALAKEKDRRYASAAELAADIRRYLDDEPILARPASATYQLAKFARRNKVLVGAVMVVFLALAGGVLTTSLQAARARREAHKAEAVSAFVRDMLGSANPRSISREAPDRGRTLTVLQAMEPAAAKLDAGELSKEPLVEAAVRQTVGATYRDLGDYAAAETNLRKALDTRTRLLPAENDEVAESLDGMAQLLSMRDKPEEAEPLFRRALAIRRKTAAAQPGALASSLNGLAELLQGQEGKAQEADALFREALELERTRLAPDDPQAARTRSSLGILLHAQGKLEEAAPLFEEALASRRRSLGPHHPDVASTLYYLALLQKDQGKAEEATASMGEAVNIWRGVLGAEHPFLAVSLATLGALYRDQGMLAEAEPVLRQSIDIQRRTVAKDDPQLGASLYNLAKLLQAEGKPGEAEPVAREALSIMRVKLPPDSPTLAAITAGLGSILTDQGRFAEAEPLLRQAVAIGDKALPEGDWQRSLLHSFLGGALTGLHRFQEAEPLVVNGYAGLKDNPAVSPDRKRGALARVVRLYEAWSRVEPDRARAEKLRTWRAAAAAASK